MHDERESPVEQGDAGAENVQQAIGKLAQRPEVLMEFLQMSSGPLPHPLHQKMLPEHITQALDLAAKHDEREYTLQTQNERGLQEDRKSIRAYTFWAFVVVVTLVVFVLVSFKDRPEVLIPLLTGIGGLFGGFLGGFGAGKASVARE